MYTTHLYIQAKGDDIKITSQKKRSGSATAVTNYLELQFPTKLGISLHDVTPALREVRDYCKL